MALVHEQTYLSKDLANIDVNAYLAHLTRDLCYAYTIDIEAGPRHPDQRPNAERGHLDPLGAGHQRDHFELLEVRLQGAEERHDHRAPRWRSRTRACTCASVMMAWACPTAASGTDRRALGMDLIHTLAGQLDTTVELVPGPGTVYELVSIQQERSESALEPSIVHSQAPFGAGSRPPTPILSYFCAVRQRVIAMHHDTHPPCLHCPRCCSAACGASEPPSRPWTTDDLP